MKPRIRVRFRSGVRLVAALFAARAASASAISVGVRSKPLRLP